VPRSSCVVLVAGAAALLVAARGDDRVNLSAWTDSICAQATDEFMAQTYVPGTDPKQTVAGLRERIRRA
jgi:predicted benzoate:H+ symporter BenE